MPTGVLGFDGIPRADGSIQDGYVSCMDGGVYLVNLESGEHHKIAQHASYASGVTRTKNHIVSGGYDGRLIWTGAHHHEAIRDVQAHQFWSWQLRSSPDSQWVASVTGQYRSGGYRYEPAPETEPSIRVHHAESGELAYSWSHLPPVLSVAISPDSQWLAAANMMGDIKIFNLAKGSLHAEWNTPEFTSWGIIKSHHYIGGIFGLTFSPDSTKVLACGMGSMHDPMAGNGKQTWQMFDTTPMAPAKILEIKDDQRGRGLMESIAFHPSGKYFAMAGRLAQGQWNVAFFDASSGDVLHHFNSKSRVTHLHFSPDGSTLILGGAASQSSKKDGVWPEYGKIHIYSLA